MKPITMGDEGVKRASTANNAGMTVATSSAFTGVRKRGDTRDRLLLAGSAWRAGSATVTAAMSLPLSPLTAMASAVTLGIADFTGGFAGRRSSAPSVAVAVESVGLVALPLAFLLLPNGWDLQAALQAFAGGAIGGLGLVGFYRAMSLNLIGVVAPITRSVCSSSCSTTRATPASPHS